MKCILVLKEKEKKNKEENTGLQKAFFAGVL